MNLKELDISDDYTNILNSNNRGMECFGFCRGETKSHKDESTLVAMKNALGIESIFLNTNRNEFYFGVFYDQEKEKYYFNFTQDFIKRNPSYPLKDFLDYDEAIPNRVYFSIVTDIHDFLDQILELFDNLLNLKPNVRKEHQESSSSSSSSLSSESKNQNDDEILPFALLPAKNYNILCLTSVS